MSTKAIPRIVAGNPGHLRGNCERTLIFKRGGHFVSAKRAPLPEMVQHLQPAQRFFMATQTPEEKPSPVQKGTRKLGDLFNSRDTNLITRIDRAMIHLVGKASGLVQEATGLTHKEQVSSVWGLAMVAGAAEVLCCGGSMLHKLMWADVIPISYLGFRRPLTMTPLQDEMVFESLGLHKDGGKYFRAAGILFAVRSLFANHTIIEHESSLSNFG